jgi:glucosamine-phosphate N-acetyltransferase
LWKIFWNSVLVEEFLDTNFDRCFFDPYYTKRNLIGGLMKTHIRPLKEEDGDIGFLDCIKRLSKEYPVSEEFSEIFSKIEEDKNTLVYVAVNENGRIVGTITIIIEQKFIHNGGKVAHIEDVAVAEIFEGKGVARKLLQFAINKGKREGCYKIILDCTEEVSKFYERFGFQRKDVHMRMNT